MRGTLWQSNTDPTHFRVYDSVWLNFIIYICFLYNLLFEKQQKCYGKAASAARGAVSPFLRRCEGRRWLLANWDVSLISIWNIITALPILINHGHQRSCNSVFRFTFYPNKLDDSFIIWFIKLVLDRMNSWSDWNNAKYKFYFLDNKRHDDTDFLIIKDDQICKHMQNNACSSKCTPQIFGSLISVLDGSG